MKTGYVYKKANKANPSVPSILKKKVLQIALMIMLTTQIVQPFFVAYADVNRNGLINNNNGPAKAQPPTTDVVEVSISNWKQLMDLRTESDGVVAISGNYIIKITENLVATCPIIITGNVHISADSDKKIYRDKNNTNFTVFTVDNGGTLTLGDNVIMTGEVASEYSKIYTLTVKDGAGNTIYKKHVYPDNDEKTIDQLLNTSKIYVNLHSEEVIFEEDATGTQGTDWNAVSLSLNDVEQRKSAFDYLFENKPDSPYKKGFTFDEWDFGNNVDKTKKMSEIDHDVTVVAKWKGHYLFKVTDGFGNIIYEETLNEGETRSSETIMSQAGLIDASSRNSILLAALQGKNGPYEDRYQFDSWNYGEVVPSRPHNELQPKPSSVTVIAKWKEPERDYKLTVTDGYGNVVYQNDNVDKTKTVDELMSSGNLTTADGRTNAFNSTLKNNSASPYYENNGVIEYDFVSWNYGNDANGNAINGNTTMSTVGGDLTVGATWKKKLTFTVTDGYGNVIYEKKNISINDNTTVQSLMQNASDWDLLNEASRNNALASTLAGKESPQNSNYTFTGWNYGKDSNNNDIGLNTTMSSLGGNLTVCATWQAPSGTEYSWTVPEVKEGTTMQIGIGDKFVDYSTSGSGYITHFTENLGEASTWVMTDVQNGSFRLRNSENTSLYLIIRYLSSGSPNFNHEVLVGGSNYLNSPYYVDFFQFEIDENDNAYLIADSSKFHPDYEGTKKYLIREAPGIDKIWFNKNKPNDNVTPYVGQAAEVTEFENSDTPGYSEVDNFNGTLNPVGYSEASSKVQPSGGYNLNSPTDSPGKQEPLGFMEGNTPNSDVAGTDVSDESASYNKINGASIEPALYRKNGNYTNLDSIRQHFVSENKGFFVKVNNGGTFDLEGATLHNFNTVSVADNTPVGVAPVYVEGNFNMTSGSIENNWVGYIADDNISGMNVTKRTGDRNTDSSTYNDVKSYLDNTTPTKTAGGIIFANGAKGVITGDSCIKGNRGDAGGIIVNGKDTDVTIGGRLVYTVNNSILDNEEYFILGSDDKFYYKDETLPAGVDRKDNNKYEGSINSVVGGGHIDNNVGFHYAGAALVENGATLRMVGANSTMNNNVTWNRGGAVYVTEFGTGGDGHGVKIDRNAKKVIENGNRQPYKEGTFIMTNGYIDNNTAFIRGGGINVESNRVFLVGGQISNNNCRALGGGIYVEGDYADYTYTLVINKGYVGHNYAVRYWDTDGTTAASMKKATDEDGAWDNLTIAQLNDRLDRKISSTSNNVNITNNTIGRSSSINANPESPLDDTNIANSVANYPNRTADVRDFRNPHEGNGGGVWLCPIGGTAVFHMSPNNEVIIDDNYASGKNNSDNTRGTDLYLHSGTGHMIVNNDTASTLEVWKNEKTGELIEDSSSGKTYSGPLSLINETDPDRTYIVDNESITYDQRKDKAKHKGIHIIDNISRDGGGIAANGTLLFGLPNDVYRHEAELDFLKEWPDVNDTYPVSFKMFYLDANDNEVALPDYDFGLNGVNNEVTEYDYSPETGSSSSVWKAKTTIPVSVTLSDGKTTYPMYKLKYTGTPFTYQLKNSATESTISVDNNPIDPSTVEGMKKLYAISEHDKENKTNTQLEIVEWKLVVKEYDASGNYVSTAEFSKIISDTVTVSHDNSIPIDVIDAGGVGKRVKGYNINFSSIDFVSKVRNGYGPETEKYINNVVHDDLVSFDETFEYEIMAYVPIDANEFIIFDTLQESLMFVDRNGNEQFAQGNETSAQNSFLSGSLSGYEDAAKLISANNYVPNYLDDFTLEPLSNIKGISAGPNNAFIKTADNYYVKALSSQGDSQSWNNGGVWRIKTTSSADDWIITYYDRNAQAQRTVGNNPTLEVYFDNNHIGDGSGTVSTDGNAFTKPLKLSGHVMIGDAPTQDQIDNNTVVMPSSNNKSGNTLYVKVDENSGIKDIRGKWIKISFNAAIKPSYRNLEKLQSSKGWLTDEDSKVGNPIPNYRKSISYVGSDWDLISGIENVCNRDEIEKAVYSEGRRHTFVRDTDGNIYDYDKQSSNPQWKQVGQNDIEENTNTNLYNLAILRLNNPSSYDFRVLTLNKQYVYKNNDDFLIDGNTALNSMLGDAIIVDGAYGDTAPPDGRMFLKDSNGNYYWAPKTNVQKVNGKYQLADGKTVNDIVWTKLTEESSNPSINDAKIRIENNNYVDSDVRDMVLTKHSYNWPVINAQEPHAGENNKANYLITRTSGKSLYKTNIVTIDVAEPEKYVNGKVHDILGAHDEGYFDQMFEYTILVKVPEDAEEVLIYDTLRPDLMFVDYLGNTQYNAFSIGTNNNNSTVTSDVYNTNFTPNEPFNGYKNRMITNSAGVTVEGVEQAKDIYYLLVKDTNDHKGDGTGTASKKGRTDGVHLNDPVTGENGSYIKVGYLVTNPDGSVSVNDNNKGNTLLIKVSKETLDDYDKAKTPIRGKWIQATFRAQIKPGSYPYIVQKLEKKETTLTTDKTQAVDYDSISDSATVTAYKIRSSEYYFDNDPNPNYNDTRTHYYFDLGDTNIFTTDKTLSPDYNVITHEANNSGYLYDDGNGNYNQHVMRIIDIPVGRDYKEVYFNKSKIKSFANAAQFYDYAQEHNVHGPYLKTDFDTIVYQKPEGVADIDYRELYENKSWNDSEKWPDDYTGPYNWEEVTDDRHIVNPSNLNSEGNHAGLANDAHYIPKFENEYHSMTTNTVTVEPKLRDLEITKKWIVGEDFVMPTMEEFKDYLHLWWEKTDENGQDSETDKLTGEITNVAKINGETFYKDHIEITYEDAPASSQETAGVRHYWKITIKNLPILRPSMKYFVTEDKIPGMNIPMYNNVNDTTTEHAHHEGGITNIEEDLEDETHVEVSKVWDVGKSVDKESSVNDIKIQLMYVEEDGSKSPVYQRDDQGKVVLEGGEKLIVTHTLKGSDPSPWSYVFTKLPLYRLTDNGDRIQKEINGKKVFIDGSGDEFCVDMSNGRVYDKDGTTELDSDQQTNRGIDVNTGSTITVNNTMSYVVAKYTVDILEDPDGYFLAYETEEIINHHYTYTKRASESKYKDAKNKPISVGALLFNDKTYDYDIFKSNTSGYQLYECEEELPETSDGTKACKAYVKSDIEYPTYEIEIVNSKPEIEKYINKDVHLKTYFANDFVYDILVYVPEEATEIEIKDELMHTLQLRSFLEPEYGHENIVTGYKETSASQINNKTIEMAVHATNNHTINGTVASKNTAGTASGIISVNGNSFSIKINNIHYWGSDFIVDDNSGEYIKASDNQYYRVKEPDPDYNYDPNDSSVLTTSLLKDGLTRIDNHFYSHIKTHSSYVEDESGNYILASDGNYYLEDATLPRGVTRVGTANYSMVIKQGEYIRDDTNGTYVLASDNNYYLVGEAPSDLTVPDESIKYSFVSNDNLNLIGGRYVQVSFKASFNHNYDEQLKNWSEKIISPITPKSELDWDVIKKTENQGWDTEIIKASTQSYVDMDKGIIGSLLWQLGDKASTITKVVKTDIYYAAKDNDGKVYISPINPTKTQNINKWFYRLDGIHDIFDLDGTVANVWESYAYNYTDINSAITSGTDIQLEAIVVPIVEHERYLYIDEKYYLEDLALKYAPEASLTDTVKNTKYVKVDWGRGDGDVIRNSSSEYGTENHAGIVNTASYEVTYGNRIKSTHKSNTVTVVPEIYELPSSGGMGTFLFNILGAMFITLALTEIMSNRRKRKKSI